MMIYCDYIAAVVFYSPEMGPKRLMKDPSGIELDLTPEGAYLSSKKIVRVQGENGRKYKITVEIDDGR
jgi:hypothetical protein